MAWSNWKVEDIGIKVLGAPAVASWVQGRLDVFIRSTDNRLFHRVYEKEAWQGSGWKDLTDGLTIDAPPAAVSWGPDRVDLFAVSKKQVHHRAYQGGTWTGWTENLNGITSDAPAAASWKPLRVDVLAHTNDNRVSRRYWESGVTQGWQNWESIGGQLQMLLSAPAAAATGPNRIDCFGRGTNARLVHCWYQGVIQESWREIDSLPFQGAPAVVSSPGAERGRVDIFARGVDDLLKHRVFFSGAPRSQAAGPMTYTAVSGDYLMKIARKFEMTLDEIKNLNPHIKPPNYTVVPGDQIAVVNSNTDAPPGQWGGDWEDINAGRIAGSPAAAASWSGNILKRIDCFAQDTSNNLIHTWWT